jgi:membrane protease YdiL (CAAX protease family)
MTAPTSGTASGDEPYAGPPPTLPPEPRQGYPAPWAPAPWQPGPWGPAPWGPGAAGPAPWGPAPWAPAPWGPGAAGPAPWGPAPWGLAPWAHGVPPYPPPYPPLWLPPGTPPHDEPQPFLLAMRSRTWRWWRPAVGLLLFTVVYVVAAIVTFLVGGVGVFLAEGMDFTAPEPDLSGPGPILVLNLVTAVAIPVVWLAWGAVHGMRIGWSSSVLGRLRWRLFPAYVGFALLTIGASIGLFMALAVLDGWEVDGPVASYGWLMVVVLLTTPLQSAAEEYMFRGYLSQAVAGWIRDPRNGAVLAAVVTATLFSFAHLPPDLPTFLQYFLVGVAASAVVWLTGGLEAAIALHAVNNVVIFVLAGALGEDALGATESQAGAGWFDVLVVLVALAAFVGLVARSRRLLRPELLTPAHDLRPPFLAAPALAR